MKTKSWIVTTLQITILICTHLLMLPKTACIVVQDSIEQGQFQYVESVGEQQLDNVNANDNDNGSMLANVEEFDKGDRKPGGKAREAVREEPRAEDDDEDGEEQPKITQYQLNDAPYKKTSSSKKRYRPPQQQQQQSTPKEQLQSDAQTETVDLAEDNDEDQQLSDDQNQSADGDDQDDDVDNGEGDSSEDEQDDDDREGDGPTLPPADLEIDEEKDQVPDTQNTEQMRKSFDKYKSKYSKDYQNSDQIIFRFVIYSDNAKKLGTQNAKNKTYRIHINQYADQTLNQFQSKHLMKNLGRQPKIKGIQLIVPQEFDIIPVDWRVRNATSTLKRQGECGSCWAFSVTGVVESHLYIRKKRPLTHLSVQQLVDCCSQAGFTCFGCEGSWPGQGMKYAASDGFALAQDYPYTGQIQSCKRGIQTTMYLNSKTPFNQIKGPTQLAFALLSGPVSAVVDSSLWDPLYDEGIFDQCTSDADFNHAVIVVGVDEKGVWIVRNSWGRYWGEGGHIRLPPGNSCGVADWGITPILDDQ